MSAERTPITSAGLDDLDEAALSRFVQRRAPGYLATASVEEVAIRCGLLAKMGSRVHPTAPGLLAFGHAPQLFHPEWGIGIVRAAGVSMNAALSASEQLEGSLATLVEGALAFVRAHSSALPDETAPERHTVEYPSLAVREALVNALVHRDLRRPSRVLVRVFDDRLEIWSPGGLPEGLGDPEEALDTGGLSVPRNPTLAAVARGLGLCEQVGRGLPTIREAFGSQRSGFELSVSPASVQLTLPSRFRVARHQDPS